MRKILPIEIYIFCYGTLRVRSKKDSTWGTSGKNLIPRGRGVAYTGGGVMTKPEWASYPSVHFYKTENYDPPIIIGDIFKIRADSPEWYKITHTEVGAGYVPVVLSGWDFHLVGYSGRDTPKGIIAWHREARKDDEIIPHGDWFRYLKEEGESKFVE